MWLMDPMRADSPPRPPPASQRDRRRTAGALRVVEVPTPAPADGPALLDARPRRPRLRPGLVRRRRLVRPLTEAVAVPLAIVIAPAGYGKTTLLAEWAAADERPFAWLTLFERDNDPVHLLGAVIECLHELEPFPREVFGALMTARSGFPAALLPTFAGALESRRRRCVLVLDDVHAVRAPAALEALRTIADHIGAGSVLALASRTQPALPIGRLRAEQGVVELGTEQLAMTEREAMQLLRGDGVELRQEDARAILRRTEGWPAGLHLAARALREQHDTAAAIARFRGDDRLVADYLREEVLSRLDADELAFMLGTSPLEALSDELCAAVLDEPGCGRTLHELARSNLLLVPLDRREERFRHHTLLGEMLQAELRRTEPQRAAQTHRRASDWHERHGDVARALDHAISANETDRAGQLLWALTPAYAFSGRDAAIGGWLERFGEAQIAARPALALAAATHRLLHGERDGVEGLAAAAERGLD
ncbi:MAG: ATP-dependent transcriptional regulator, MalT-like, LuxR family, partial [Conexibacter sp.]|nr:ATP-dependent transcriptional regulator, MalT-like, LuxR family [Conexibacter sp.]